MKEQHFEQWQFLLFRLYGTFASWGDITVGEIRPTAVYPSKSAIIGLIAAAFGYTRDQEHEIQALTDGLGVAVRVDREGLPLRDFQTFQKADAGTGRNRTIFYTRRDELLHDKIYTGLSTRDYRTDALYTVCLWKTSKSAPILEDIIERFHTPHFALYLGRKSCVMGLPIYGVLIEATSIRDAFMKVELPDTRLHIAPIKKNTDKADVKLALNPLQSLSNNKIIIQRYYWQECSFHGFGDNYFRTLRRDEPRSRTKWQFGERFEYSAILEDQQVSEVNHD